MSTVFYFTFNPFQENSYIVFDESGEGVIIDPGCFTLPEKDKLAAYIQDHNLKIKMILNGSEAFIGPASGISLCSTRRPRVKS